jgi:hypothetical protein
MSESTTHEQRQRGTAPAARAIRATIRRRLLVNALVDPDEVARRLPDGVRPHVIDRGGTVVGCCLVDFTDVRPARVPAGLGISFRAAADRISVEWDDTAGRTTVGVYVPVRCSDSRLGVLLGGRRYPGVQRRVRVLASEEGRDVRWSVDDAAGRGDYRIRLAATVDDAPTSPLHHPVGATCVGATFGLSPTRQGGVEAARMDPDHRVARELRVDEVSSTFLSGFTSARPAPSYLLRDVQVTWSAAPCTLATPGAALPGPPPAAPPGALRPVGRRAPAGTVA